MVGFVVNQLLLNLLVSTPNNINIDVDYLDFRVTENFANLGKPFAFVPRKNVSFWDRGRVIVAFELKTSGVHLTLVGEDPRSYEKGEPPPVPGLLPIPIPFPPPTFALLFEGRH